MKKQKIILTALIILALSSGCGKAQPVSETETTSEIENTIIKETEESTIETETEIASETETQSIEAETEPIATEEETETEPETILPESETATVELDIEEMDGYLFAQVNVALREKPTVESKKLKTVASGTRVHVTGMTSDGMWYRVDDSDNGSGFISGSYLGVSKPAAPAPAETQQSAPAPAETAAPAPAETQQPAPAPAETQDTSQLTGQALEDFLLEGEKPLDINSIPNLDTATSAEEYLEKLEHSMGAGGILHAG